MVSDDFQDINLLRASHDYVLSESNRYNRQMVNASGLLKATMKNGRIPRTY